MAGWTKGPWGLGGETKSATCGCHEPYAKFELGDYLVLPAMGQPGPVAIVAGAANARLIAEAPAMAEALRKLVAVEQEAGVTDLFCDHCSAPIDGDGNVAHEAGCPLGDAIAILTRIGEA